MLGPLAVMLETPLGKEGCCGWTPAVAENAKRIVQASAGLKTSKGGKDRSTSDFVAVGREKNKWRQVSCLNCMTSL
jgi:hypothetical protein